MEQKKEELYKSSDFMKLLYISCCIQKGEKGTDILCRSLAMLRDVRDISERRYLERTN
jgi:hypothetical protein